MSDHLFSGGDKARAHDVSSPEAFSFWEKVINEKGAKTAYELFGETYKNISIIEQHSYAHVFGEALYKTVGIKGVAICDRNYNFGCYHSFFGWALLSEGLSIIIELDQACIDVHGEKGLGCQHGIGHGILVELGHENLDEALEACTKLNWQGEIGGCTDGVFMEFNFDNIRQVNSRTIDERGPHYPCNEVPERFTQACYFAQPAWWGMLNEHDYVQVGEYCAVVENDNDRIACFRGTGNMIAGVNIDDITGTKEACDLMPTKEGRFRCIEGVIWIISAEPQFKEEWRTLCVPYENTEYYDICIKSTDLI